MSKNSIGTALQRSLAILAVITLVSILLAHQVNAQQSGNKLAVSDGGIYKSIAICDAYLDYLNLIDVTEVSLCGSTTEFLIQNSHLDILRFMKKFHDRYTPSSAYGALSGGLIFVIEGNAPYSFAVLDTASTLVFGAFLKIGEEPRATLYAALADEIKILALKAEIGVESNFLNIFPDPNFGELLGPEYAVYDSDENRADHLMLCLLRADNLRVSVVQVVTSPLFIHCINNFGE
ncbi:MAG: hypothetical protein ACU0C9_04910 [Paracoccaceae bacterium]